MLQCVQMFRAYRESIGWMMSVCVCVMQCCIVADGGVKAEDATAEGTEGDR